MIALFLSLAALAADPPAEGPKRTPTRGVPGMPSPTEILWGGDLEALFHVHDGDVAVGVGHWGWPTLAAPPTSVQMCVLDLTVTPDGETTAEKRWCDGALADALDPAPWKLVPLEGQAGPVSRRITVYALPDGQVIGALYGTDPAQREKLPDRFAYATAPVPKSPGAPDGPAGCRFQLRVDEKGRTTDVAAVGCPDAAAAVAGLKKWRHQPAEVLGRAVPAELVVPAGSAAVASSDIAADPGQVLLRYGSLPPIAVTSWTLPAPVGTVAHCEVSFDFRPSADRRTYVDGCQGAWRQAVEQAVATWTFADARLEAGEAGRRYRVGVYSLDGGARVAMWGVAEADRTALPAGFTYGVASEAKRAALDRPEGASGGWCAVVARVDAAGGVAGVDDAGCAEPYAAPIRDAVTAWRFTPASVDGAPVPAVVEVWVDLGR